VRTAKSTKNTLYIDSLCEVGGLICRVRCDFWTLRMSSGGVFKRRRLVCLAGLSGASRNRLINRLPNQTSVAAATHCLLADQWHVHDWPHNVVALFTQWARIISEHRFLCSIEEACNVESRDCFSLGNVQRAGCRLRRLHDTNNSISMLRRAECRI
jgi:hypothetical protein